MAVLNLVPKADQELDVLALGWLSVAEILSKALRYVRVLRLAVCSHIPDTDSRATAPRAPAFSLADRMENSGPGDVDEPNELRRAKVGARSVISIDGGCRRRATLFD